MWSTRWPTFPAHQRGATGIIYDWVMLSFWRHHIFVRRGWWWLKFCRNLTFTLKSEQFEWRTSRSHGFVSKIPFLNSTCWCQSSFLSRLKLGSRFPIHCCSKDFCFKDHASKLHSRLAVKLVNVNKIPNSSPQKFILRSLQLLLFVIIHYIPLLHPLSITCPNYFAGLHLSYY